MTPTPSLGNALTTSKTNFFSQLWIIKTATNGRRESFAVCRRT
jgi:hypothetical protein